MTTKFWDKGFNILQNIDDRLTMQKHGKRPLDKVDRMTKCSHESDTGSRKENRLQKMNS